MTWQDFTNGAFELLGAVAIFGHVLRLWKDKAVKGVSLWSTVFFASWGFWNLYYYPHLSQWASFAGGCGIVLGNCIWIAGMVYYLRKPGGRRGGTLLIETRRPELMALYRKDAYAAIDSERAYQDAKWPESMNHEVDAFALYIVEYAAQLQHVAGTTDDKKAKLDAVRKVGALAVACMEYWGAPVREEGS